MVTGKKYAIDFTMSDGSVKTVEFEIPLAELVGAVMRDGSTPMEGNLPMGGFKITGMSDPEENADAATKGYADTKLAKDGSVPMGGDLDMGGHRVKDVAEPEADGDAVNLGYANENFAPAGCGLGGVKELWIESINELDELKSNGWFGIANGSGESAMVLEGVTFNLLGLEVSMASAHYGEQTVKFLNGFSIRRKMYGDAWGYWEWINPPMVPGVEYRTIERFNDKSKFKQVICMGTLAVANSTVSVAHGISDATHFIGCRGIATMSNPNICLEMVNGGTNGSVFVEGEFVRWNSGVDLSAYTGFVEISYTKD